MKLVVNKYTNVELTFDNVLKNHTMKFIRVVEAKLHAFKTSSLRRNYVAGYTPRPLNPWEMNPLISYGQCGVPSRGKDM